MNTIHIRFADGTRRKFENVTGYKTNVEGTVLHIFTENSSVSVPIFNNIKYAEVTKEEGSNE